MLAKGTSVHEKDEQGLAALHYAAKGGHIEILNLLLDAGGFVDSIDKRNGFYSVSLMEERRYL